MVEKQYKSFDKPGDIQICKTAFEKIKASFEGKVDPEKGSRKEFIEQLTDKEKKEYQGKMEPDGMADICNKIYEYLKVFYD